MGRPEEFLSIIRSEFPDDRLTFQKAVATFHPETAEEASRLIQLANKHGRQLYITGFGNNVDPVGEPFVNMVTIRTDRLNGVEEVAPADFYVRTGSGYPLREINEYLAGRGLFLPHSSLPSACSVGGGVAVNLSAELDGQVLPIRKYFIKAEIVTPTGEIITPGSVAFKSVSGYDIVKLFAPSWGLLGLIVSATFRVLPASIAGEYAGMRTQAVRRDNFLAGLDEANRDPDAVYCRKIKNRFDPRHVLPVI